MGQTRSCSQESQKYSKWLHCNFTVSLQRWGYGGKSQRNRSQTGCALDHFLSYCSTGGSPLLCAVCVGSVCSLEPGVWSLQLLVPASPMTALHTTIDLNNHVSRLLKDTTSQGIQTYLNLSKLGQSTQLQNIAVCLTKGSLSVRGKLYLTYSLLIALMQFYEH